VTAHLSDSERITANAEVWAAGPVRVSWLTLKLPHCPRLDNNRLQLSESADSFGILFQSNIQKYGPTVPTPDCGEPSPGVYPAVPLWPALKSILGESHHRGADVEHRELEPSDFSDPDVDECVCASLAGVGFDFRHHYFELERPGVRPMALVARAAPVLRPMRGRARRANVAVTRDTGKPSSLRDSG